MDSNNVEKDVAATDNVKGSGPRKSAYMDAVKNEQDPLGFDPHDPGAKLDHGKPRVGLVLQGFARALWKVSEVGTFGANKYTDNGWMVVPNGKERYTDAGMRHFLKEAMGEEFDQDSHIEHLGHEAWNALAKLELALREKDGQSE